MNNNQTQSQIPPNPPTPARMLSVCEIAAHLARSERYVYQIKANAPEIFIGSRAYISDIIAYLRAHPSVRAHALEKKLARVNPR